MEKTATQLLSQLGNPDVLKSVLATAGVSGLAGGFLTAQTPQRAGETPGQRRMRIVRNALLTAGAGGGAMALGRAGLHDFASAVPSNSVDPVTGAVSSPIARAVYGGGVWSALNKGRNADITAARSTLGNKLTNLVGSGGPGGIPQNVLADIKSMGGLQPSHLTGQTGGQVRGALDTLLANTAGGATGAQRAKMLQGELLHAGLPSTINAANPAAEIAQNAFGNTARSFGNRLFGGLINKGPTLVERGLMKAPIARTALAALAALGAPAIVGSAVHGAKNILSSQ